MPIMLGAPSSERLRWPTRRIMRRRAATASRHLNRLCKPRPQDRARRPLTTEQLFATIIEHMFASPDIRRLLTLIAASAVILAFVMSYAAPRSSGASHPRRHAVRAGEPL